jgi:hypothetical protein
MKKILLGFISLLLIASVGYCEEQPIQIIIKSDKSVYEIGEEVKILFEFKNISSKPIEIDDSYASHPADNFYISNDYGEKFEELPIEGEGHLGNGILEPNESFSDNWRYLYMDEDKPGIIVLDEKGNTYRLAGKHRIYAKRGDIVSNTITIELIPKSSQGTIPERK